MIKRIGQAIHPFSITFIPMLISAMILLALSGFYESFNRVTFSATAIASLIYLGILGSVVTFVSYFWLLKRVEPVFLSLTAFVTPILAVILGTVVYGEELSSKVLFGALFVLAGILIANAGDIKLVFVSRKTKT
jgi:drug/metabolite transporter (DMT)-like permease